MRGSIFCGSDGLATAATVVAIEPRTASGAPRGRPNLSAGPELTKPASYPMRFAGDVVSIAILAAVSALADREWVDRVKGSRVIVHCSTTIAGTFPSIRASVANPRGVRMWPLRRKPTPTLERTSEGELIWLARGGNGPALREIMRRNNRRLFHAARAIIGSDWEAEEVVQEAYVRAFRALEGFREEAALATWLTRIAINEAQSRLRGRREHLPLSELDDRTMGEIIQFPGGIAKVDPERQAALTEIRQLLEKAIDALPEPFREVFVLRQVDGLSVEETAQVLSVAPETVKTRLHRARLRLRRALQDQLEPALKDTFPFEGERCRRLTAAVLRRLGHSPGPG